MLSGSRELHRCSKVEEEEEEVWAISPTLPLILLRAGRRRRRGLGCSVASSPGCGTAGYKGAEQGGGGEGTAAGLAPFLADRREGSAGTQPWREEGRPPGPLAPTRAPPPQLALPESGSGPRSSRLLPAAAWRASPS